MTRQRVGYRTREPVRSPGRSCQQHDAPYRVKTAALKACKNAHDNSVGGGLLVMHAWELCKEGYFAW